MTTTHLTFGPVNPPSAFVMPRMHPRRDALVARLLSSSLDARLAQGVAPASGRYLAVRAAQLVEPARRHSLAESWEHVLARASEPRGLIDSRVPVARAALLAAEPEIAALVRHLRSPSPVSARGVARARRLLTDGTSPVYWDRGDLSAEVSDAVAALRR